VLLFARRRHRQGSLGLQGLPFYSRLKTSIGTQTQGHFALQQWQHELRLLSKRNG